MIQPARSDESSDLTPLPGGDSALEDLIEDCTNRLQAGESIDLDDLAARHPQHAERLRRLLPSLRMMADVGRTAAGPLPLVPPAGPILGPSSAGSFELGDYRILRMIGRGGMGVVYEATQLSLNRRVALKVLPFAAALDPHQLRRFQIEAQAAAQLHHTSIVPVFSVGCERGVHFYAMQYIEGRTVAALIQDRREASRPGDGPARPSADREYLRSVARLGIQAAEALDHAHRQGIIHRDVKPANLLVDARGNLWITDFGLARFVNETGLTLTGDLVGTLRYMSPEQALARRLVLDHRTDIYSLGATLYELLSLHPVVAGRDRQEVLRRIAQDEPTPPRRIDPVIPRDVETVLLKALAREPEERYATAQDLADDLRRYLEHRPIKARRPGVVERAAKWLRRHPVLLGSGVSVLLLTVFGLTASLIAVNHERARTAERAGEAQRLARALEWELYVSRVNQAHGDYQAGNVARAEATLAACPESLRNWEWRFVRGLCYQERWSVRAHDLRDGMDQLPVSLTLDGTRWISGAGNSNLWQRAGELKLWETASGRLLRDLAPGGLPGVRSLAMSPDGHSIAVGFVAPGIPIQLREISTGRIIGELADRDPGSQPRDLAFSPDGRRLAGIHASGRLAVWDVADRRLIREWEAHEVCGFAVAFQPERNLIASAGTDGQVRLWDSKGGRLIHDLRGHDRDVFDLAFSPDGRYLASGGWDQTVRIWDIDGGRQVRVVPRESGFIERLAFSRRGDRFAVASGQAVTLWSTANWREVLNLYGQNHFGAGLEFSPDGAGILTSALDGTVRLWDATSGAPRVLEAGGKGWVNHVAFSPDGSRLIAAFDAGCRVVAWDLARGTAVRLFQGDDSVRTALFTPLGDAIVSASWDSSVRAWDVVTGRPLRTFRDPSPNDAWRRSKDRGSSINDAALSPDGSRLAAGGWDRRVHIWDFPSGREVISYDRHRAVVWSMAFAPDGRRVASAGADRTVRVWDAEDGRDIWTVETDLPSLATTQRRILAFSPDGRWLAGCLWYGPTRPSAVQIWEAATGARVRGFYDPAGQLNAVAFSPDGTRIATAGENRTVTLWDTATGQSILTLRGHTAAVLSVAFSPDGQRLASGSVDATVRIWDAPEPRGKADGDSPRAQTRDPELSTYGP